MNKNISVLEFINKYHLGKIVKIHFKGGASDIYFPISIDQSVSYDNNPIKLLKINPDDPFILEVSNYDIESVISYVSEDTEDSLRKSLIGNHTSDKKEYDYIDLYNFIENNKPLIQELESLYTAYKTFEDMITDVNNKKRILDDINYNLTDGKKRLERIFESKLKL